MQDSNTRDSSLEVREWPSFTAGHSYNCSLRRKLVAFPLCASRCESSRFAQTWTQPVADETAKKDNQVPWHEPRAVVPVRQRLSCGSSAHCPCDLTALELVLGGSGTRGTSGSLGPGPRIARTSAQGRAARASRTRCPSTFLAILAPSRNAFCGDLLVKSSRAKT